MYCKGEFLHGRWKSRGRDKLWLPNVNVTFSLAKSFCHFNFFVFFVLSLHSLQSHFFLFSWKWDFYITTHSEKLTTVLQFLPPLAAITITTISRSMAIIATCPLPEFNIWIYSFSWLCKRFRRVLRFVFLEIFDFDLYILILQCNMVSTCKEFFLRFSFNWPLEQKSAYI